jgi:hypothetical protein
MDVSKIILMLVVSLAFFPVHANFSNPAKEIKLAYGFGYIQIPDISMVYINCDGNKGVKEVHKNRTIRLESDCASVKHMVREKPPGKK